MTETTEETAPKKKKAKRKTPPARALEECRRRGWTAQVVERWNPYAKVLHDLFGCIDIIALTPDGILGIQATGGQGGNHAARVAKIAAEPRAELWKKAGGMLVVWSYAQRGAAGERKLWTLREEIV